MRWVSTKPSCRINDARIEASSKEEELYADEKTTMIKRTWIRSHRVACAWLAREEMEGSNARPEVEGRRIEKLGTKKNGKLLAVPAWPRAHLPVSSEHMTPC